MLFGYGEVGNDVLEQEDAYLSWTNGDRGADDSANLRNGSMVIYIKLLKDVKKIKKSQKSKNQKKKIDGRGIKEIKKVGPPIV